MVCKGFASKVFVLLTAGSRLVLSSTKIPACLPSCAKAAALSVSCSLSDASCICGSTTFAAGVEACLTDICDASDFGAAQQYVDGLCPSGLAIHVTVGSKLTTIAAAAASSNHASSSTHAASSSTHNGSSSSQHLTSSTHATSSAHSASATVQVVSSSTHPTSSATHTASATVHVVSSSTHPASSSTHTTSSSGHSTSSSGHSTSSSALSSSSSSTELPVATLDATSVSSSDSETTTSSSIVTSTRGTTHGGSAMADESPDQSQGGDGGHHGGGGGHSHGGGHSSKDRGASSAAIGGAIGGGIAALLLLLGVFWYFLRRWRQKLRHEREQLKRERLGAAMVDPFRISGGQIGVPVLVAQQPPSYRGKYGVDEESGVDVAETKTEVPEGQKLERTAAWVASAPSGEPLSPVVESSAVLPSLGRSPSNVSASSPAPPPVPPGTYSEVLDASHPLG
ncbi:uncharacterized protein STEHIDRAFT_114999 [Stereum hirsutum FP-91666 SS1]|uniref:uncharacterized protein n=1 Tax=Stereum hirsutum (strain FP-91666) TaxID=721885 RepID=UPI000444A241|nr:uncharacterized protein STEHIDRAFT_114999 [Stereum hirsutum FP-91666 SS1]EIM81589.1 hypothetical protein STEHIDRAFT_114999 [Stereum hirsutum FP-91666 SS1]